MDFCFENQGNFTAHEIDDINTFTAWWANQVAVNFGLNESDLIKIYGDKADDVHETWQRVEDLYWYGNATGFDYVPALFINGVLQETFPETEEQWIEVISAGW